MAAALLSTTRYRLDDKEERILEIVIENPGIITQEILNFVENVSMAYCYKHVNTLCDLKFLRKKIMARSHRLFATPKAKKCMKEGI